MVSVTVCGDTSILLIEGHTMYRQVMAQKLSEEPGLFVSADVGSVEDARKLLKRQDLAMVITDVDLPGISGIELVKSIKSCNPNIKIVMLSALSCEETFISAIRAGVDGYALKDGSYEQLLHIIRSVASGQTAYDQSLCSSVVSRLLRNDIVQKPQNCRLELSPREWQVAELVSKGMTNKEIAQVLSISLSTTKTHVSKIFKRLNVSSRRQFISRYFRSVHAVNETGWPEDEAANHE